MPIKHKMSLKKKESWKDPQTRVLRKHEQQRENMVEGEGDKTCTGLKSV